jgi:hypothetical protein
MFLEISPLDFNLINICVNGRENLVNEMISKNKLTVQKVKTSIKDKGSKYYGFYN